jgi:hypothetical protein
MKLATLVLIRDEPATATILAKQYIESVPFWKITWAPQHVVFHTNEADENELVVYRADRIFEFSTGDLEE